MAEQKSVTIKDVAKATGVSAMTVTRVYGKGYVSPKTRKKVEAMAKKLGYYPNSLARGLRGGKTNSIGILWSLGGPHNSQELVRETTFKLSKLGYVNYVVDSLTDPKIVKACLRDYISRNIDGLIFQAVEENLKDPEIISSLKQISNVVIETHLDPPVGFPFDCIVRSRSKPMLEIVNYLASKGRKRLCLLAQKLDPDREEAYIDGLTKDNILTDDCRMINGNLTDISPDFIEKLNAGKMTYDAVITANDEIAAAMIKLLNDYGKKVPDDVAVIGYNDNFMSRFFIPPIASVERRNKDFAQLSVDMLMEQINNERTVPRIEYLDMRLVKRESAG